MNTPGDYIERVYAGVLGKLIGVYLGRPFEGWTYERIVSTLGEVDYYVHDKLGLPLIVTDDDIAGTFTFPRAFPDNDNTIALTPEQIGQTWLNYLVENRSILWWGGMGNSTEHTAYLRLKNGIPAPMSGSCEMNGKIVSDQIGSQIFIDGWAMICPGDPERAADFARRAASVSHDGEAIYGAQVIAAMESLAFVESDLEKLLDTAVSLIPSTSTIFRLIQDLREWRTQENDWHATREKIVKHYGYDKYPGNCHMVPNHALIHLALLYGQDDFQKSLMIVNTAGWDTDCNSGNVGCILGIKNGLRGIDTGPDWRGPMADRLYLSTADGGRCITDAVAETFRLVNIQESLAGMKTSSPKDGARFHFELPGSVQGFRVEVLPETGVAPIMRNVEGHSIKGKRSLAITCKELSGDSKVRISTPTFILPEAINMPGYRLMASPALYSGQIVTATIAADEKNGNPVACRLFVSMYGDGDCLDTLYGPEKILVPGSAEVTTWQVPDTLGAPIAEIGFELSSDQKADGTVYLDSLTWHGSPQTVLKKPDGKGTMWRRAWINAVDHWDDWPVESFRPIQDTGRGFLGIGCREWTDYQVTVDITPYMMKSGGIAAYVQGLRRYYALLLCKGHKIRLIKMLNDEQVLGEASFPWQEGTAYSLSLQIRANHITASVGESVLFDLIDSDHPLTGGGVALVSEEGCFGTNAVEISPAEGEG